MADYQAKSNNTSSFEVTEGDKLIGKLSYKSWFKFDAALEMANKSNYQIEPKGFWGTTVEIKDGEKVLLTFTMNWNGEIIVHTYFNNIEKDYIFKHRGFFKEFFILTDQEGTELLGMKPHIKWSNMNYEYQITTTDFFETIPNKDILLMNSLHCANYFMTMMAGAM